MVEEVRPAGFDPEQVFRTLARHDVRYVLIGGLAGVLHGSPLRTNDIDICPDGRLANLRRLAGALTELEARLATVDGPVDFPCDPHFLKQMLVLTLDTRFGRLDVCREPAGTRGYDDLLRSAVDVELTPDLIVPTAALRDVIRSKQAAGRPKDAAALPTLEELARRREH